MMSVRLYEGEVGKDATWLFMSNGEVASFLWRNTADVMTLIRCLFCVTDSVNMHKIVFAMVSLNFFCIKFKIMKSFRFRLKYWHDLELFWFCSFYFVL